MKDREFAQALLVEALDASKKMSYVETLFRATAKPNTSVQGVIKAFAKKALTKWFKSKMNPNDTHTEIYETVRTTLSWTSSSVWRMRNQGLDMDW
jgi:hypothetical protein